MAETLDPRRTALVIVDMQRASFEGNDERARLLAQSGIIECLVPVVEQARARGVTIVYILNTRRADGSDQVTLPTASGMVGGGGRPVEGTPGWEVVEALRPAPGDVQVIKRRRNAFYGSDLDLQLHVRGITTLLLCGQRTTIGIESTARDAFDRDYALVVLSDGCGGVPPDEQEWAMTRTFPGIARVVTCAEVAGLFA